MDGHFHAVVDVANIAKEMSALAIGTGSQITLSGNRSGKSFSVSGSF
jgi:hypothetical protein